jgi:hypothetical protein
MANPLGEGGSENPPVHSKGETWHGKPWSPGKAEHPGDVAEPAFKHERHEPSRVEHKEHGTVHHYHHDHPAMAGAHHGSKAKHPHHDAEQAAYEKHGYGGKR